MDLWVVAAATGAGYVAKYWRNLTSKETESSSESLSSYSIDEQPEPRNLLQRKRDQTNPFWRLAGKHDRDGFLLHEEDFSGVTIPNNSRRQGENNENLNLLSVTSFSQVFADNESFRVIGNGMQGKINLSDASGHLRSSYHGNYLEPLDSTQSSLRAQLYREYVELEEYVYNSVPSQPRPTLRPLLLTDGRQIISRASRDFIAENEMPLLPKKLKNGIRKRSRRFSMTRESIQPFHSQGYPLFKFEFYTSSIIYPNISCLINIMLFGMRIVSKIHMRSCH